MLFATFSSISTHSYSSKWTQEINFKAHSQNLEKRLLHIYICVCEHTHIYTHIHTHTNTHIYIYNIARLVLLGWFGKKLLQLLLVYLLLNKLYLFFKTLHFTCIFSLHIETRREIWTSEICVLHRSKPVVFQISNDGGETLHLNLLYFHQV
jgi:hypothetical protein